MLSPLGTLVLLVWLGFGVYSFIKIQYYKGNIFENLPKIIMVMVIGPILHLTYLVVIPKMKKDVKLLEDKNKLFIIVTSCFLAFSSFFVSIFLIFRDFLLCK